MRGLFLRIFASFWLAMLLVLAGSFLVFEVSGHREFRRARADEALRLRGERAFQTLDTEGRSATETLLRSIEQGARISILLLRDDRLVAGEAWEGLDIPATLRQLRATPPEAHRPGEADESLAWELDHADHHLTLVELPTGTLLTRRDQISALGRFLGPYIWARLLVVALVAGLLALLLARYLTHPLGRLRSAAQRLAEGDLEVRVAPQVQGATQEVEALGADLDRMAERISELLTAQRRLLQDVSHELRSPLARLHVALGLARRSPEAQHLDRIELEAERLGDLIGQILTLSRLSELRNVEVVDLRELLGEIVQDADYEARATGRLVSLEVQDEIELEGSRDVLRWAVENVLRNAVRFAPEQSVVEVRMERRGENVAIEVRDHGPGVPSSDLEAIFRPFFRVAPDRDRKTGGRGLGLAIAERAVRVHGGTIEAVNTEQGLQVTLTVPSRRATE